MKIETHITPNHDFNERSRNLRDRNNPGGATEVEIALLVRSLNILITENDPAQALNRMLTVITKELGAHSAAIWICNSAWDMISLYEATNVYGPVKNQGQASLSSGAPISPFKREVLAHVMAEGPLVIRDATNSRLVEPKRRKWMAANGIRSLACIPLPACRDITGVLTIRASSPDAFDPDEGVLGNLLSLLAGLAVQLLKLTEHVEESAVLKERERFAEEIHDGLTQCLAAIVTRLELALDDFPGNPEAAFVHVRQAQELAREGVTEARRTVWALAPLILTNQSLPRALENLSSRLSDGAGFSVVFSTRGKPQKLGLQAETNLLRIAQEAISNALRHGQATKIHMELCYAPNTLTLTVEDNGRGFEFAEAHKHYGFGLFNLRDRTQKSGGELKISSSVGGGTRIVVEVPTDVKNTKSHFVWKEAYDPNSGGG